MTAQNIPVDASASTAISSASTVMAAQNTPAAATISSARTEMAVHDTPASAAATAAISFTSTEMFAQIT